MEKITNDVFKKWMQKNNWLKVYETPTPTGRQDTFLTPAGNFVAGIYDLSGNLSQIAMLMPASQSPPPLGFPGGKGFPILGKG